MLFDISWNILQYVLAVRKAARYNVHIVADINPCDSMYSNPWMSTHENAPIITGIKLVYPALTQPP